jgi:predicted 2-oxoglutarate/Fe(II)-dependent dioxygenase YbiX
VEKECLDPELVFVIRDFLTPEECRRFIEKSEAAGYDDAPISTGLGFVMRKDIRDNARVIDDNPDLAREWFARARPFLPEAVYNWRLAGFNERFRYYRYDPGQKFDRHTDGYFERSNGERSQLTFMVYLNDGFEGGTTNFHHVRPVLRVKPVAGMALVFRHRVLHEGAPILSGRKYVLRTDVMYARKDEE